MKFVHTPYDHKNNPYQNLLTGALEQLGVQILRGGCGFVFLRQALWNWKVDGIHFHWLTRFLVDRGGRLVLIASSTLFLVQVLILRVLGKRIVWTAHNLIAHETRFPATEAFVTRWFIRITHTVIAHCDTAKELLVSHYNIQPPEKVVVIPHGNYIGAYPNEIGRADARRQLNLASSQFTYLFLGQIHPYKGVLDLIRYFKAIDDRDTALLIAGRVGREDSDLLERAGADDERIRLYTGFIEDQDIQRYINAADVVVFPYRDVLTSGALLLAMSFGKACIAPRIGCMGDVLETSGGFLYDPSDENGLPDALVRTLQEKNRLAAMGQRNLLQAEKWNWDRIAELTKQVYENGR